MNTVSPSTAPPPKVRVNHGATVKRIDFAPRGPAMEPACSVVIPVFGDAYFVTSIFRLQRILDPSFEIIVVCDDPRISERVMTALESRRRSYRVPMTLLCLSANCGYGAANNLGASVAGGRVLVLMNSDVFISERAPLVEVCQLIAAQAALGKETIVGFSLLFEDETIQHIGMDFVHSSSVGDLFIARHPLKGTPLEWYDGPSTRRVQAVTGALLCISQSLYSRLYGYDPLFARGDFEDADLCLRARSLGTEILVLVRPGLYHLERQSFRHVPQAERWAMTLANCRSFNRRWGRQLSAKVRVIRGGRATG